MSKAKQILSILVVEDNPGDYFLIEDYLEEMFAAPQIHRTRNYVETKVLLSEPERNFDVVLLDVSLPDREGLSMVNDIIDLADQCPVLILTGYENLDFSMNSLSLGVTDYLLKDEINAYSLYKSILFSIERKKYVKSLEDSEKRYSELFHLGPIPMWLFETTSFQILNVNDAAVRHYGYSEKEFLNMTILDLLPDFGPQNLKLFDNLKPGDKKVDLITQRHCLKSGKVIIVEVEKNLIEVEGRTCCIMMAKDMTEFLETQDSLITAYQEIVNVEEKAKERFAAEIHDGLAQNLVTMNLIFSMIRENFPEIDKHPSAEVLSKTIENSISDCRSIVRNVMPKDLLDFGFNEGLIQVTEKARIAGNLQIELSNKVNLDDHYSESDLLHIYRVLQELVNNCLKHAHASHVKILINRRGRNVLFLFKDNGVGITPEILNSPSTLISLKRRIQVLNGTVCIESKVNEGTSVKIKLPVKQD